MLNVTKELTPLARKLGYTGKAPDTVAKAIDAITASVGSSGSGEGCDCKIMVVHMGMDRETGDTYIFDATAGEIYEAMQNGYIVFFIGNEDEVVDGVYSINSGLIVEAIKNNNEFEFNTSNFNFIASSPNEYPTFTDGGAGPVPFNPINPSIPDD